ncbi:MAG: hypothetical protein ABI861_13770 [Panacibacter sp.]
MEVYKRSDLLFDDYEWTEPLTHVKLQGAPDRNLFMRYEGNEILYMINYACEAMNYTSRADAERIEALLHDKLPIDIRSQSSVFQWLRKEYDAYKREGVIEENKIAE